MRPVRQGKGSAFNQMRGPMRAWIVVAGAFAFFGTCTLIALAIDWKYLT
jgi:hypothetical protein